MIWFCPIVRKEDDDEKTTPDDDNEEEEDDDGRVETVPDMIFFLTDGRPTTGKFIKEEQVLHEINRVSDGIELVSETERTDRHDMYLFSKSHGSTDR